MIYTPGGENIILFWRVFKSNIKKRYLLISLTILILILILLRTNSLHMCGIRFAAECQWCQWWICRQRVCGQRGLPARWLWNQMCGERCARLSLGIHYRNFVNKISFYLRSFCRFNLSKCQAILVVVVVVVEYDYYYYLCQRWQVI